MLGQGCPLARLLWEHPDKRRNHCINRWIDGGLCTQTVYAQMCVNLVWGSALDLKSDCHSFLLFNCLIVVPKGNLSK